MSDNATTTSTQSSLESSTPSATILPFTIRIVRTEDHLAKAVQIRSRTYGRHHPEVAHKLSMPEEEDRAPFSLVLLAESKIDGEALGTLRIETNTRNRLPVEELLPTESECTSRTIAYVTRLGVEARSDASLTKLSLFKALHRYCLACQIDWIVVTAKPPMDRQYKTLGFTSVFEEDRLIPIPWSANIPMKLMSLETISCERVWRKNQHPLYKFMFKDFCPDIQIFQSVSGIWKTPRLQRNSPPSTSILDQILEPLSS